MDENRPVRHFSKETVILIVVAAIFGLSMALIGGTCIGFALGRVTKDSSSGKSSKAVTSEEQEKLEEIEKLLDKYCLYDYSEEDLTEGIYKGVAASVGDPYTEYYTKEETDEIFSDISGEYGGIGALLTQDAETKVITVVNVFPGSPAEKSGILPGDYIISVAGEEVGERSLDEVVKDIRGDEGTVAELVIVRDGEEMDFSVTREIVESKMVYAYMLENKVGYIDVMEFTSNMDEQFIEQLNGLMDQGMKGLIIDLRSNPGGDVDACCNALDALLPQGCIIYTEDKNGDRQEYSSTGDDEIGIPVVVLVNGYSASASEIFAGCLMDREAATIVGTQSYGKGIIQTILPLSDGSSIKITFSQYFTPNGKEIQGKGITPDVIVEPEENDKRVSGSEPNPDSDAQFKKALEVLESQM